MFSLCLQLKAIPTVLAGKDALIKSQTGSGKTLAYALPIIHKLQEREPKIQRTDGLFALVVVPTRELVIQVNLSLFQFILDFDKENGLFSLEFRVV